MKSSVDIYKKKLANLGLGSRCKVLRNVSIPWTHKVNLNLPHFPTFHHMSSKAMSLSHESPVIASNDSLKKMEIKNFCTNNTKDLISECWSLFSSHSRFKFDLNYIVLKFISYIRAQKTFRIVFLLWKNHKNMNVVWFS